MEQQSLLAEVALRLAKSPEDVATEGLAYLLTRSETGRTLIRRIVADWLSRPIEPISIVKSQVDGGDGSRPDLECQDSDGSPLVIFENKFWAGLTEAQPNRYLQRLETKGGGLWFVAPSKRLRFLWPELLNRTADSFNDVETVWDKSELKLARVGEHRILALTSWAFLLDKLGTAFESEGEISLVSDIRQLMGLAAKMETAGFVPLSVADLTAPTARHVVQFCELVNSLVESFLQEQFASKKGLKASAGQGWYGHYIRIHGYGCNVSFHAPMWFQHGRSPIWLSVKSPDWKYPEFFERAMDKHFSLDAFVPIRDGAWSGVWIPLSIPEGRELDAVIEVMVKDLNRIAAVMSLGLSDNGVYTSTEADGG